MQSNKDTTAASSPAIVLAILAEADSYRSAILQSASRSRSRTPGGASLRLCHC